MTNRNYDILGHWIWAVPVLFLVAFLSIRQIDLYPPTWDEFVTMFDAGWVVDGSHSPIDVLNSMLQNSPDHVPLYYLMLYGWRFLVGNSIAVARVLTILMGVLSIAMVYRLSRDVVAPIAGIFAIIVMSSNAFYSFYIANTRMYPLLVFSSTLVVWIYLRIVDEARVARGRDYVALFLASFVLASTHAFSALIFFAIGICHLFVVGKNQRWWRVSIAMGAGPLLLSPWIILLVSKGIERAIAHYEPGRAEIWELFGGWLNLTSNGSVLLLFISAVGVLIGWRQQTHWLKLVLLMLFLFLFAFGLIALISGALFIGQLRYLLGGWPLALVVIAAGLYVLYSLRKGLAVLVLLSVVAGLSFTNSDGMEFYLQGRSWNFHMPPWHQLSRLALNSDEKAPIIAYRFSRSILDMTISTNVSQNEHYFARHGILIRQFTELESLDTYVSYHAITEPVYRLSYQTSAIDSTEVAALEAIMDGSNYEPCQVEEMGNQTVIVKYWWKALRCQDPQPLDRFATGSVNYESYGATVDENWNTLFFSDRWSLKPEFSTENDMMSFQLISEDWENVAQLDIPLVNESSPRQFSIDISNVAAGTYKFMAILYDTSTGDRQKWIGNDGYIPELQMLAEIIIPEATLAAE